MKNQVDHIIYTCQVLEKGMNTIEQLLGIRPVYSGKHPMFGTHTALLSLGNNMYFEVIAPDPNLEVPAHGLWLERFFDRPPGLSTWVMSTTDLKGLRDQALSHGIELGQIQSGKREKIDGTFLHWKMTDPYQLPMEGMLPFVIDWGDTPHPSINLPLVGELRELKLIHPNPELLNDRIKVLGINLTIEKGSTPGLKATIYTSSRKTVVI